MTSAVTSRGGDEVPIAEYMNHFLMVTGIRPLGAVWATMGAINAAALPDDICNSALELGENFVLSWKEKTVFSENEKTISEFKERMRSLMLLRKNQWPHEYQYWKQHRGPE